MKLAIMQPYFLPYIGYFQLLHLADRFVIYDNIKFTKKGWIHRNRILVNGKDDFITLPLKADSDFLDVRDRRLADSFARDREALLRRIEGAYRKAPCFGTVAPLVQGILRHDDLNLFGFILHSVRAVCAHLGIATDIVVSSTVPIDHSLRAQDKVIALCQALGAEDYVNPIGGTELYDEEAFARQGIRLWFHQASPVEYAQGTLAFVPWLSILDVMMFNPPERVRELLGACTTFRPGAPR